MDINEKLWVHDKENEGVCGETWDHDLQYEYADDGSWTAVCENCGGELWSDD